MPHTRVKTRSQRTLRRHIIAAVRRARRMPSCRPYVGCMQYA